MVFYYESTAVNPPAIIYIGKDKFENEELIKYGWEEDFHADNLSSAHIYLRLQDGQTWNTIPAALIEDCAQLTKAGSIEGSKRNSITIIYTPWSNLRKDSSMAVGQVSFHDQKKTAKLQNITKQAPLLSRLRKTMTEIPPPQSTQHLQDAQAAHASEKRRAENNVAKEKRLEEDRKLKQLREEKERSQQEWEGLYGEGRVKEEGKGNWEGFDEDDFM